MAGSQQELPLSTTRNTIYFEPMGYDRYDSFFIPVMAHGVEHYSSGSTRSTYHMLKYIIDTHHTQHMQCQHTNRNDRHKLGHLNGTRLCGKGINNFQGVGTGSTISKTRERDIILLCILYIYYICSLFSGARGHFLAL